MMKTISNDMQMTNKIKKEVNKMNNFTKRGMSMFVVIAMMMLGGGELQAKGALHGTILIGGGPPNGTIQVIVAFRGESLVPQSALENLVPSGGNLFMLFGQVEFDSDGFVLFHFATPLLARTDMTAASFSVFVGTGSNTKFALVPLVDVNQDTIIDAKDTQELIVVFP